MDSLRAAGAGQRELGSADLLRRLLHVLVHTAALQRGDAGTAKIEGED